MLLAAVGGELHVVALRMTANLLHDVGYGVMMLGADVPPRALASAAAKHRPEVVCLTATMPGGAERVLLSIYEIMREWPQAGSWWAAAVSRSASARGRGSRCAGASRRSSRRSTPSSSAPA